MKIVLDMPPAICTGTDTVTNVIFTNDEGEVIAHGTLKSPFNVLSGEEIVSANVELREAHSGGEDDGF
jgi:hypothetical protein